ncbi:hypothetical protein E0Z10_g5516 [Xylaria hypoxylon]|uniref:Uncharacterized protein n=1 Tax=Xylaria hypoxylon TaxID=37992 RepID=A0A4Z0YT64_9PEZI|nr:hypothetical protein E0Z10_g5516 [Xylaria hypoxylon]
MPKTNIPPSEAPTPIPAIAAVDSPSEAFVVPEGLEIGMLDVDVLEMTLGVVVDAVKALGSIEARVVVIKEPEEEDWRIGDLQLIGLDGPLKALGELFAGCF